MSTATFDTLIAVRKLRDAGYAEPQAEAIVRTICDSQTRLLTGESFEKRMAHVDGRFNLLQWMFGFNLAATFGILWKVVQ